jgi:hypothetical protein
MGDGDGGGGAVVVLDGGLAPAALIFKVSV